MNQSIVKSSNLTSAPCSRRMKRNGHEPSSRMSGDAAPRQPPTLASSQDMPNKHSQERARQQSTYRSNVIVILVQRSHVSRVFVVFHDFLMVSSSEGGRSLRHASSRCTADGGPSKGCSGSVHHGVVLLRLRWKVCCGGFHSLGCSRETCFVTGGVS